jgi:hypothetical protein
MDRSASANVRRGSMPTDRKEGNPPPLNTFHDESTPNLHAQSRWRVGEEVALPSILTDPTDSYYAWSAEVPDPTIHITGRHGRLPASRCRSCQHVRQQFILRSVEFRLREILVIEIIQIRKNVANASNALIGNWGSTKVVAPTFMIR